MSRDSRIFASLRCNCAEFHNCRLCVTDFRKGAFLKKGGAKRPVLNRVNELMILPSESSKILVKHEIATVKVLI